jgi:hypothetical protein
VLLAGQPEQPAAHFLPVTINQARKGIAVPLRRLPNPVTFVGRTHVGYNSVSTLRDAAAAVLLAKKEKKVAMSS